ncbi:unnamed protein product, partial [Amoebophrya sp. A25]
FCREGGHQQRSSSSAPSSSSISSGPPRGLSVTEFADFVSEVLRATIQIGDIVGALRSMRERLDMPQTKL